MKRFLTYAGSFAIGALAVAGPMFLRASIIHADETARHEPTMQPGITMFFGLMLAPIGGLLAVVLVGVIRWRRNRRY